MKTASIFCTSLLVLFAVSFTGVAQDSGARASFRFEDMSLRTALDSLMKLYPFSIIYLDKDIEGKVVSATCTDCRVDNALGNLLSGSGLTWTMLGNQIILKERGSEPLRQRSTIAGTVTDSVSGELIAGATVLLQDTVAGEGPSVHRWCATNQYGFYSMRNVMPGTYGMVVRILGYQTAEVPVAVVSGTSVLKDVRMTQKAIEMQEVTAEAQQTVLASVTGLSRGVYIRSTPSDQNQYLLDGARIYNPAHLGGVLTTFNAEVLHDVQVTVGGVPPYYGGRIGGILDLSMREGTMERLSGSVGTGSLGSNIILEGPLSSSTTFLFSGRRGYPDVLVPYLENDGTPSRQGSSELIAKLSRSLSGSDRLFLSGYVGRDSYSNQVEGGGKRLNNHLSWGNTAVNLRWISIASPSLFLHASAVYTHYDFSAKHFLMGDIFLPPGTSLSSDYGVDDIVLRAHAEHYYDEEHTVRGGAELIHHALGGNINEFSSQLARLSLAGLSSWELSVYLQDQWKLFPRVTAELGARATTYIGEKGSYSGVDPRFSLLVSLDDNVRLYSSLSSINQFIHPYRNSGIFLFYPTVFWYPSTDKVRPSTSLQVTLGVDQAVKENAYLISVDSYYRITHNIHEFVFDAVGAPTQDMSDVILFGTGKAYGVEFSVRKRTGDLNGWVNYNLSWAANRFAELNEGNPFEPPFNRRHELQMGLSYAPGESWMLGFLAVVASEQSRSLGPRFTQRDVFGARGFIDLNGSRLPGFQRLELSVQHRASWWGIPIRFSLRLLNGYGLLDPFEWELRDDPDIRSKWTATLRDLKLFPLYPAVGLSVKL